MADEQLMTALSHWAPRFTANGVDASDFSAVASSIERWDDWCAAWSRVGAMHESLGREALGEGRWRSAGEHLAQGATAFHFGKFLFVAHPEEARTAHRRAIACLSDALQYLDPPGERHVFAFGGAELFAVLRRPRDWNGAVVVCIPGLDSTKEEFRMVEAAFLDRGLATFALDGPGQGEAEYALAIRADWEVPGAAVLEYLGRLDGVDPDRIGVWGVSLGGHYAARMAAGLEQVRACVSLAGPYNFAEAWDKVPDLTRQAFTVRAHATSESDARGRAAELDLTGRAGAITCPLLVVFGKRDRLFSHEGAARLVAEAAGPSELLLLEDGNHGCANEIYRHRPRTADWMARQLRA